MTANIPDWFCVGVEIAVAVYIYWAWSWILGFHWNPVAWPIFARERWEVWRSDKFMAVGWYCGESLWLLCWRPLSYGGFRFYRGKSLERASE